MTLRLRLALIFAVTAVCVAGAMGVISYAVAAGRLAAQADEALTEAASRQADRRPDDDRRGPDGDRFAEFPTQALFPDGTTTQLAGPQIPLPVDDRDLEIAASPQAVTRYRTDEVQATPIRMLTAATGDGSGAIQVASDYSESVAVLRSLAATLSLIGGGVAILAALVGWLLAHRLTDRLVSLTSAAEAVGRTGRLDVAVPGAGSDEVGRLAGAFTIMLQRLAASRAEQQRLIGDVGHELRTPLTSLRTNVELLPHFDRLSPAERSRVFDDLTGETAELTTLVNEAIDLATDVPLNAEPVPVRLADVCGAAAARARRRTGREVLLDADDSVVLGTPAALERAVWNLLDNAVKFAPHGPIEVRAAGGAVTVADHGPGIAAADLPHVFERFYRSLGARGTAGSGLGLSIVAEVAATHGGSVTAGPRRDGRSGAVLGITLPLI